MKPQREIRVKNESTEGNLSGAHRTRIDLFQLCVLFSGLGISSVVSWFFRETRVVAFSLEYLQVRILGQDLLLLRSKGNGQFCIRAKAADIQDLSIAPGRMPNIGAHA